MKQLLFFFSWLVIVTNLSAQDYKIDTVIKYPNYTSYFSYKLHEPVFVVYKLYKGGGNCSRDKDRFTDGGLKYSAEPIDYAGNGYDEGHLANSKDFAYDCKLQEATFRFFNCVPQTPALNRGCWKVLETKIRQESQKDSLLIICGSLFSDKAIGKDNIAVPSFCWKIAYKLKDNSLLHSMAFPNNNSQSYKNISVDSIRQYYPKLSLPF